MIYWRKMPEGLKKTEQTIFAQQLLADALQKEYGILTLPEIAKDSYGKPFFPEVLEIPFNYSHTKNGAVCVISAGRTGIDLEIIRPYQEKTARHFCTENEWNWLKKQKNPDQAWIQIWTRKEACVKYTGTGIRSDLRKIDTCDDRSSLRDMVKLQENGKESGAYLSSFLLEDSICSVCSQKKIKEVCCI